MDTHAVTAIKGKATGVALIAVDKNAENCITIAPEANAGLGQEKVFQHRELIASGHTLLMQLETPIDGLMAAAATAKSPWNASCFKSSPGSQAAR